MRPASCSHDHSMCVCGVMSCTLQARAGKQLQRTQLVMHLPRTPPGDSEKAQGMRVMHGRLKLAALACLQPAMHGVQPPSQPAIMLHLLANIFPTTQLLVVDEHGRSMAVAEGYSSGQNLLEQSPNKGGGHTTHGTCACRMSGMQARASLLPLCLHCKPCRVPGPVMENQIAFLGEGGSCSARASCMAMAMPLHACHWPVACP